MYSEGEFHTFEYFQTKLDLKNGVDLLQLLLESQIRPSPTKEYTHENITNWTRFGPRLCCNGNMLQEISICVDFPVQIFINYPVKLQNESFYNIQYFCEWVILQYPTPFVGMLPT